LVSILKTQRKEAKGKIKFTAKAQRTQRRKEKRKRVQIATNFRRTQKGLDTDFQDSQDCRRDWITDFTDGHRFQRFGHGFSGCQRLTL
jgi:hypothetical protein